MEYLSNFIKGIFIGSCAILPGISSGVICMVLGLYEKLLYSVLNLFKNIKENIQFLLPIVIGAIIGIILFSKVISYCFNIIPIQTKSLFIGLLLGSIYILFITNIKDIHSNSMSKYISFWVCFLIGIVLIYLENNIKFSNIYLSNEFSPLYLILSGFFMSIGIVVPGVSSTIILMLLGVYTTYLNSISSINLSILFPMIIGVGIGSIIFMNVIQYLLNNYHSQTIFGIIGFSLGSMFVLYPCYSFNSESLISIFLLLLGFKLGKNLI